MPVRGTPFQRCGVRPASPGHPCHSRPENQCGSGYSEAPIERAGRRPKRSDRRTKRRTAPDAGHAMRAREGSAGLCPAGTGHRRDTIQGEVRPFPPAARAGWRTGIQYQRRPSRPRTHRPRPARCSPASPTEGKTQECRQRRPASCHQTSDRRPGLPLLRLSCHGPPWRPACAAGGRGRFLRRRLEKNSPVSGLRPAPETSPLPKIPAGGAPAGPPLPRHGPNARPASPRPRAPHPTPLRRRDASPPPPFSRASNLAVPHEIRTEPVFPYCMYGKLWMIAISACYRYV